MTNNIKDDVNLSAVVQDAISQAQVWAQRAANYPVDSASKLLAKTLATPGGLDFTIDFVDRVIRPEDKRIAARNLAKLSTKKMDFLPPYLSVPAGLGARLAPVAPNVVVKSATEVFRKLVGNLVLDTTPKKLAPAVRKLRSDGSRLNLNLLGEAVLGNDEAERRLAAVMDLLDHDEVDYVSIKVSAVLGMHNPWGYQAAVEHAIATLLPLYEKAARLGKFINLDMEEYHDLHLTIDVFQGILSQPQFQKFQAGIVLQAYLPDSLDVMIALQDWARERVASGGAPIKVRLVKGANLPMERVDAVMHGWQLATQQSKAASDANYLRILEYALRPEHLANIRLGIAGHNMFTLGFALSLIRARGITSGYDVEMLKGMAPNQARAVSADVESILYYVPVVNPAEFDVAISYLVRRLEESAAPENFMSHVFDFPHDDQVFAIERDRYLAAVCGAFAEVSQLRELAGDIADDDIPQLSFGPRREQNRQTEEPAIMEAFANTPDSDPSLPANLEWAAQIRAQMPNSTLGVELADAARVSGTEHLSQIIDAARDASSSWAQLSAGERAGIIRKAGQILAQRRAELITVAGSECGKILSESDSEVSEAIDFCNYYAELATELPELAGVAVHPVAVTAAITPWNFPIAIATGSIVAPLATGSAVVFKPAVTARRTGACIAQALWDAGVPREVLHFVDIAPEDLGELGRTLVTETDQTVFTGSLQTAQLLRSWKPELRLFAETSGKNAIIVTEQADIDLAARDIVASAFGHAGQKCSAASLVILVGTMNESRRLLTQIVDAARSLVVAYPHDPTAQMGPVIEPASGKLATGLTKLGPRERWILTPRQLDDTGRLWSPGIRVGVKRDSDFHRTEYFGPVLGIMHARDLDEAIDLQNAVDYGLTGGIHTLDGAEIEHWLERVQVGNAYVNRTTTGAIVRRQPFGGWKRSSVGTGSKAGGPDHLLGLVHVSRSEHQELPASNRPLHVPMLSELAEFAGSCEPERRDIVTAALENLDEALVERYLATLDRSELGVEKNILRYIPTAVEVRIEDRENWDLAMATVMAAMSAGSDITLSVAGELPGSCAVLLYKYGVEATVESHEDWLERLALLPAMPVRIRYIGGDSTSVARAVDGSVDVAIYDEPMTGNGRVDLRPFFLEQSIAATNHRFGDYTAILDGVL